MTSLPIIQVECGDCVACCSFVGVPPFDDHPTYVRVETFPNKRDPPPVIDTSRPTEFVRLQVRLRGEILAEAKRQDWTVGEANGGDDGADCIWLDRSDPTHGACKHHEQRPDMCKRFEYASSDCIGARKARGLTPHDPRDR